MTLLRNFSRASAAAFALTFVWAAALPAAALAQGDAIPEPLRVPREPNTFWAAVLTLAGLQLFRSIRHLRRHP